MALDASEIDWLKVNLLYRCPFSQMMLKQFIEKRKYWQANPRPIQLQPTSPKPIRGHLHHRLSKAKKRSRKKKQLEGAASKRRRQGKKHTTNEENDSEGKTSGTRGAGGRKRKALRHVSSKKTGRGGWNKKKKGAAGKRKGRGTRRTRKNHGW